MKCGLIGCGRIAHKHIAAMKLNKIDLVAVCDLDTKRMSDIIADYGEDAQIRRYVDYEKMLKEETTLDFVSIATDSGSHFEIAQYCMMRGISIILEKPITLSI